MYGAEIFRIEKAPTYGRHEFLEKAVLHTAGNRNSETNDNDRGVQLTILQQHRVVPWISNGQPRASQW